MLVSPQDRGSLAAHARKCEPYESCALLCGSVRGGDTEVRGVITVPNADASPDRFSVAPADLIGAYERASSGGLDVVGIFHSHPASPALPSEADVRYMRSNPVAWLIYSGLDRSMRAFVLDGGAAKEVPVADYTGPEGPT